jgi:mannose-6-phosphate isomerase-like protein (cupin superfamily)
MMISEKSNNGAGIAPAAEVEYLKNGDTLLAIIIPAKFHEPGIRFFTPNDFSQQLAYMRHPEGKLIIPHVHNPVPREVRYTLEALFIKSGKLRVDFYDATEQYLESRILFAGDVIFLASGGHGFEMLEETEMIEVKQGPYTGEEDKRRFEGISSSAVRFERQE